MRRNDKKGEILTRNKYKFAGMQESHGLLDHAFIPKNESLAFKKRLVEAVDEILNVEKVVFKHITLQGGLIQGGDFLFKASQLAKHRALVLIDARQLFRRLIVFDKKRNTFIGWILQAIGNRLEFSPAAFIQLIQSFLIFGLRGVRDDRQAFVQSSDMIHQLLA